MDHTEALQQMAAERYLLDELPAGLRDAFEEHLFDCPDCALDVRTEAAFLEEAKLQLSGLMAAEALKPQAGEAARMKPVKLKDEGRDWLGWLRPIFANPLVAGPVFAALLVLVGYQNLVTVPTLRIAANEPRLAPMTTLHAATRSAGQVVEADRTAGASLVIELPEMTGYSAYTLGLADAQGKTVWTSARTAISVADSGAVSLVIPAARLSEGAMTLVVSGVPANGQAVEVQRQNFHIHFKDSVR